jgi:hypothetical protein
MKQSPFEKELIKNLGPSKFSGEGFLGTDRRPVNEIIEVDARILEQRGVSKAAVVEALRRAYEKARGAFGGEVVIRPGVTAVFHESMGRIPSPFRGDGVFEKGEAVVEDKMHGSRLIITRLGVHLIAKHGFFQGRGSRYRTDPETVIHIFDLRPEAK